jgi:hypothetical protein
MGLPNGLRAISNSLEASTTLDGSASQNIFQITGVVQINYIHGWVSTALAADVTAARLDLFPTAGAAINLTDPAGVDISSTVVGSFISKTATAATALTLSSASLGFLQETTRHLPALFVVGQETAGVDTFIRLTRAGAGASGVVNWSCEWQPISEGSLVVAA